MGQAQRAALKKAARASSFSGVKSPDDVDPRQHQREVAGAEGVAVCARAGAAAIDEAGDDPYRDRQTHHARQQLPPARPATRASATPHPETHLATPRPGALSARGAAVSTPRATASANLSTGFLGPVPERQSFQIKAREPPAAVVMS